MCEVQSERYDDGGFDEPRVKNRISSDSLMLQIYKKKNNKKIYSKRLIPLSKIHLFILLFGG